MTFDDLYARYAADVHTVAAAVAGPDLAEDGAQEAWAKLAANLHRVDGTDDLRAWVRTVARNACRDVVRRHRRRTALDLPMGPNELATAAADRPLATGAAATDPAESVARRDSIARALDAMRPADRRVLLDRLAVGLSYNEIHDRTGASDPAMRTSMMRGRQRFTAAWLQQLAPAVVWRVRRVRDAFARWAAQLDGLAPLAVATVERHAVAAALALGIVLGGGASDDVARPAPPLGGGSGAVPVAAAIGAVGGAAPEGIEPVSTPSARPPRRSTSASLSTAGAAPGPVAGTADVTRIEPDAGDLTYRVRIATPVGEREDEVILSSVPCDDQVHHRTACAVADAFNAVADRR